MLIWCLRANNIFAWFWTLLQWNFMARSASIDSLAMHNFKVGPDSIVGKYDTSKADQAGDRLSEKNLYANPHDWTMCVWTGLGIYCALNNEKYEDDERIFLKKGMKEGAMSQKYCEQIQAVVAPYIDILMMHINKINFNPYGLRKGGATHALGGTTCAPSIPSVARRGEWSIGSVLDCYWHFNSVGDQFLGQILAGLDPNKENFDSLAPHWRLVEPMMNKYVAEGMELTFGVVLKEKPQFSFVLLR